MASRRYAPRHSVHQDHAVGMQRYARMSDQERAERPRTPQRLRGGWHEELNHQQQQRNLKNLQLYSSLMLRGWRHSRTEIEELKSNVEAAKTEAKYLRTQAKQYAQQLEQTKEQHCSLDMDYQQLVENIKLAESTCYGLKSSLEIAKEEKITLEKKYIMKQDELSIIKEKYEQLKIDYASAMKYQEELLQREQNQEQDIASLNRVKDSLIEEIVLIKDDKQIAHYQKELAHKDKQLNKARAQLRALESVLEELKTRNSYHDETQYSLNEYVESITSEVAVFRMGFKKCIYEEIASYLSDLGAYQRFLAQLFHYMCFYILPGTPMPSAGVPMITAMSRSTISLDEGSSQRPTISSGSIYRAAVSFIRYLREGDVGNFGLLSMDN